MTMRLALAFLVVLAFLVPARADFAGDVAFPLTRPRPFTGSVTVAGNLSLEIAPGEETAPIEIRAHFAFDDAPGLLADLLSPETGVIGIADVASYCGMRGVGITPSAEGVSVEAEMCVNINLFGIKISDFQRAFMSLAITPDEDRVTIRCTSINIKKVSGEIDRALCSAIKPFDWTIPSEFGALKPRIASATLETAADGKIGIAMTMTVDPSAATNEEWRRLLRFALARIR